MLAVPQKVTGIYHPLVADMYLKKDFSHHNCYQDVLVIEVRSGSEDGEHDGFDSYLTDLLTDLEDLKRQAENKLGCFDRVDIQTH